MSSSASPASSEPDFAASHQSPLVLEENARLSKSMIWDWMRAFYDRNGVGAWANGIVPNFITTNCLIAKMYAHVVLGFLKDSFGNARDDMKISHDQPIYIVELGSGHGRFSFLLIKKLLALKEFFPATNTKYPFKYIMTDFTENNINFWKTHVHLKPLVEDGVVDFAKFDAENDSELRLMVSGAVINKQTNKNPICLIANYIFDTLRHDAFRLVDGQLQEALLTCISDRTNEPDLNDPDLIQRFQQKWIYQNVNTNYYSGKYTDMNAVLERISKSDKMKNASFLVPLGGINCIRTLMEMSNDRLFFLSGDKAYNFEEEMSDSNTRDPHIAVHGSFSMMVNYDAVRHYFESKGGFSIHSPFYDGFKVSAFTIGAPIQKMPEMRLGFKVSLENFGPDNFSTLQRCIKEEAATPSLSHVISLLRLSDFDSEVFFKFKQIFIDKAGYPNTSEKQQKDIIRDMEHVYDCYYLLSTHRDVPFEIGRLYMTLRDYKSAVQFFKDSLRDCGDHHVTHYNLGLCYNYSNDMASAHAAFTKSLELKPTYQEAKDWLARVQNKINPIVDRNDQVIEPVQPIQPITPVQ